MCGAVWVQAWPLFLRGRNLSERDAKQASNFPVRSGWQGGWRKAASTVQNAALFASFPLCIESARYLQYLCISVNLILAAKVKIFLVIYQNFNSVINSNNLDLDYISLSYRDEKPYSLK